MSHHVGRKTPKDWEESFYSLEQRHLQLQQEFLRKQREWDLAKVQQRREASSASATRPLGVTSLNGSASREGRSQSHADTSFSVYKQGSDAVSSSLSRNDAANGNAAQATNFTKSSANSPISSNKARRELRHTATSPIAQIHHVGDRGSPSRPAIHQFPSRSSGDTENIPHEAAHISSQMQSQGSYPSYNVPGHGTSPSAAALEFSAPDPKIVWGAERTVEHFVQVNNLYQMNEQLRRKIEDMESAAKLAAHEIANLRQTHTSAQSRTEELNLCLHQAVRERDLAVQKLQTAQHNAAQMESAAKTQRAEMDNLRQILEQQIHELRSRLLVSADSNEGMSKDVRTLLTELKERTSTIAGLQSKLTLTETTLTSQKHLNESLLVEMKNLNDQLTSERKRSLALVRETQVAALSRERVLELEGQVQNLVRQRSDMEKEHLRMLEDFVQVTKEASSRAHDDVKDELHHFQSAAAHWEGVCQLLYKDIVERTQAHLACREDADIAKKERDESVLAAKALREELRLSNAKLNIVWPTHRTDTAEMDPEHITRTFHKIPARFANQGVLHTAATYGEPRRPGMYDATGLEPPSAEDMVAELEHANAALLAEVESLRLANELLQDNLAGQRTTAQFESDQLRTKIREACEEADCGYSLLQKREDRIQFLEQQVQLLRGEKVPADMSLESIGDFENVFELFIGQIISTDETQTVSGAMFCTVDFLVHETVATRVIHAKNGFLDTSVGFRVGMDALLVYYLKTRGVMIQLHSINVESPTGEFRTVAEGFSAVWEIASNERLDDKRPTLRGTVKLYDILNDGRHVASVEFVLTARAPFSQHFKSLCKNAALHKQTPTEKSLRRIAHEGDFTLSQAQIHDAPVSAMVSQQSIGPSVSVPKVNAHLVSQVVPPTIEPCNQIRITLRSVKLLFTIDSLPKLSCYFALPTLMKDEFLPPLAVPSYEWTIDATFAYDIESTRDMFRLLRDPLALFFFDEGGAKGPDNYWATAVCDLGASITAPDRPNELFVDMISYQGCPVGKVSMILEGRSGDPTERSTRQQQLSSAHPIAAGQNESLDHELLRMQCEEGNGVVALPANVTHRVGDIAPTSKPPVAAVPPQLTANTPSPAAPPLLKATPPPKPLAPS